MKKKVLNAYSGVGGNRKKWQDVEVTAVEEDSKIAAAYQYNFGHDKMILADAHEYLLKNHDLFDFVWSSPPCPSHSRMVKATRHKLRRYPDMRLYQEIIFLTHFHVGPWVVENVKPYYKPLIEPTAILGRHYFWSNFDISKIEVPSPKGFITNCNVAAAEEMKKWLGLNYKGNLYYQKNHCPAQILRNCVHPDLGLHVFNQSQINERENT